MKTYYDFFDSLAKMSKPKTLKMQEIIDKDKLMNQKVPIKPVKSKTKKYNYHSIICFYRMFLDY